MKISADLKAFSKRLGHEFKRPELLIEAVTHASISSETRPDNQRLEFLGDRVLGLAMAQELLARDPKAPEGKVAPRFNALVRKETCAYVAQKLDLGSVLKLGRSEMLSGGRQKIALLGDGMEAVIAAVYLDAGFEVAQKLIIQHWSDKIESSALDARDPKTILQEWAQALKQVPPLYEDTARSGPDHAPQFTVTVQLDDGRNATAVAASKRQAQQAAAAALLSEVQND